MKHFERAKVEIFLDLISRSTPNYICLSPRLLPMVEACVGLLLI